MTAAMRDALDWLLEHGGDGSFSIAGWRVFLAGGESAPVTRATWNKLSAAGLVEMYGRRRMRITEAGRAAVLSNA